MLNTNQAKFAVVGYGLSSESIQKFMRQHNVDPDAYDQRADDYNDHKILNAAVKETTLDYFSPVNPVGWFLYAPSIKSPETEAQLAPIQEKVRYDLTQVIMSLYHLGPDFYDAVADFVRQTATGLNEY